jgi:hypothetical protein
MIAEACFVLAITCAGSLLYLHINRSCFISFSSENLEE